MLYLAWKKGASSEHIVSPYARVTRFRFCVQWKIDMTEMHRINRIQII